MTFIRNSVWFTKSITKMAFMLPVCLLVLNLLAEMTSPVYAVSDGEMFKILLERTDKLEMSDAANKREIAALKSELGDMKITFSKKEENYVAEINQLKSRLRNDALVAGLNETSNTPVREEIVDKQETKKTIRNVRHDRNNSEKRSLKVRTPVETEVAFYATHSQHDVQHLGQNQIIVFDQAVTNIGNAYNHVNGAFVAPVAGTYVFHVTMMGKDVHAVRQNHFSVHIDVDGKVYSQLYVEPYDQSSQMFVIELKPGKTVSIKNHILDDGYIGQHFSSFSGFLLYEHQDSFPIIGK